MSATQVQNGKAFEWAVACELAKSTGGQIQLNAEARNAENDFNTAKSSLKTAQKSAAEKAIAHILQLEKLSKGSSSSFEVIIQPDSAGKVGDVRDVILSWKDHNLGISCKNNHRAFKHSRLSADIDFVQKWGLSEKGASKKYWNSVIPIFERLKDVRLTSDKKALWRELPNKSSEIYEPILSAFEQEIHDLMGDPDSNQQDVAAAFIDYVIGNTDFYKVIAEKGQVEIIGFNFHGSLRVSKSKYPTKIHSIERHLDNAGTSILRFQEGHTFSFRIHNASSRIEPSLKFDIQALSLPSNQIYSNHILY